MFTTKTATLLQNGHTGRATTKTTTLSCLLQNSLNMSHYQKQPHYLPLASQLSRTWYDCGRNYVPFQPMVNDEQEIDGLVRHCGGSSALDYAIGVFMPSIFQCMFAVNSATHDYGTRQKDHYKVPKVKLEVVKNAVRYRGVIIWNMILQNIDIATSLHTFKFHLRRGILSTLITSVS